MYGRDVGALRVYRKSVNTSDEIFMVRGTQGDFWVPVGVKLPPMKNDNWVSIPNVFVIVRGTRLIANIQKYKTVWGHPKIL